MPKANPTKSGTSSTRQSPWIARDEKSGRFVEVGGVSQLPSSSATTSGAERRPGRFKGVLTVGPEFFEALSEGELAALGGA
jgi:hypothetical protein